MRMRNLVPIMLLVMLAFVGVGMALAQALEPVELQPTFILMDGTEQVGLVYGLDYGWVVNVDGTTFYTCGCNEEVCTTYTEVVTVEPTDEPYDPPDPTVEPTEPPPTQEPTEEPPEPEECRPGYGWGDENHCHSGPPGQNK